MVALAPASREASPPLGEISSGAFALELIQRQTHRLARLQREVLADRDPEPIHQLRVSLRRLRTALAQFGPALELPEAVTVRRIASVARRTGLCRDLDVLRLRLEDQLLPQLPPDERQAMERPLRQLARDREQAFAAVVEALHSSRYLKVLARLQKWQRRPRFSRLGEQPLQPWLHDWQSPFSAGLFLHPAWLEEDPAAASLHDLRKRIKGARYALESLQPWCSPPLLAWIGSLRLAQDHLGELHDLQVLRANLADRHGPGHDDRLPTLTAVISRQQAEHWQNWRELAARLWEPSSRRELGVALLDLGQPDA